jgi:transposase
MLGRSRTGRADCVWLAKVAERGMGSRCLVPSAEIRLVAHADPCRRLLIEERLREKQRAESAQVRGMRSGRSISHLLAGSSSCQALSARLSSAYEGQV